jgi:hypothetical protein
VFLKTSAAGRRGAQTTQALAKLALAKLALARRPVIVGALAWLLVVGCQLEETVPYGPPGGLRRETKLDVCPYPEKPANCPSWQELVFPIILESCAAAGSCHDDEADATAAPAMYRKDASLTYASLAGQQNAGRAYIKAGGQDTAYILCNLEAENTPPEPEIGAVMPQGDPLSDADRATIAQWVSCGMNEDGGGGGAGGGQGGTGGQGGAGGE